MKRLYSCSLETGSGPKTVEVELSQPAVLGARFIEHEFDRATRISGRAILACNGSLLVRSENVGKTWMSKKVKDMDTIRNAFTSSDGNIIVCGTDSKDLTLNRISVIRDGKAISNEIVGRHGWHGTFSIDENEDCIIFSEYPNNGTGSAHNSKDTAAHVFRSRDGGLNWTEVFRVDYPDIRHFHTCTAIPRTDGSWLITSGDDPAQCRFWLSEDNGDSWLEVTDEEPNVNTHPGHEKLAHRTVVMHVTDDYYIWATDDPVGNMDDYDAGREVIEWPLVEGAAAYRVIIRDYTIRDIITKAEIPPTEESYIFDWNQHDLSHDYRYRVQYKISEDGEWEDTGMYTVMSRDYRYFPELQGGDNVTRSRLVRSSRNNPLSLDVLCELGMHIRSMIDVGEAYIMISEAKFTSVSPCPQVYLVFKDDLNTCHHLFNLPNPHNLITGSTYSRSSISAIDGVFFTQMQRGLLSEDCEMVKWEITITDTIDH